MQTTDSNMLGLCVCVTQLHASNERKLHHRQSRELRMGQISFNLENIKKKYMVKLSKDFDYNIFIFGKWFKHKEKRIEIPKESAQTRL